MARRLRVEYPGAVYHVINRGNYRRDLFETEGAAGSFEAALGEAAGRSGWKVHAFVIMRNHFHLAIETPTPNLVDGMHWLQTTFALRFNRFRSEHGHLFQGRYQALILEDDAALLRVVDYIHLNPVRARVVTPAEITNYHWSSLARFVAGSRPNWLSADRWLGRLRLTDSDLGWASYVAYLAALAVDPVEQQQRGFDELSRGWAIGTAAWKQALAREYAHLALAPDLPRDEVHDLRHERWESAFDAALRHSGKDREAVIRPPRCARWKVEIAWRLRKEAGASYRWIAEKLSMGSPSAVRVAVCRFANM